MKKLLQFALALGFSLTILSAGSAVQAQDCTIENTGPDSNNECVNNQVETCVVENNTVIEVNGSSEQGATSGGVTVGDNTSGGGASSGDADNNNSSSFTGTIVNGACVPNEVTPENPGGQGAGTPARPAAATPVAEEEPSVAPAALPNTSATSPAVYAGLAVAGVSVLAVASRFGLAAYSRIKS